MPPIKQGGRIGIKEEGKKDMTTLLLERTIKEEFRITGLAQVSRGQRVSYWGLLSCSCQ